MPSAVPIGVEPPAVSQMYKRSCFLSALPVQQLGHYQAEPKRDNDTGDRILPDVAAEGSQTGLALLGKFEGALAERTRSGRRAAQLCRHARRSIGRALSQSF